jgi:spore coat polysaccharide biosynthesis protein SpsF
MIDVGVVIQCRMLSKRLPCKAMLDLNGVTLLGRVIQRVRLTRLPIFLATSDNKEDDFIEDEAIKCGIDGVFRGALHDVRGRFIGAARHYSLKSIVRVTADNPFTDPRIISAGLRYLHEPVAYVRANPNLCPDGVNSEIFRTSELEKSIENDFSQEDLEHVTPAMIKRLKNTESFLEFNPEIKNAEFSQCYHLGIDTTEDYLKIKRIYQSLDSEIFKQEDLLDHVLRFVINNPEIFKKGRRHAI